LFSTLAFSFSTHALIRAYLFSVSTLERIISEDRYKSICSVKKKISNLRAVTSNGILHTPLLFDPPETFSAAVGSAASDTLKIQSYN